MAQPHCVTEMIYSTNNPDIAEITPQRPFEEIIVSVLPNQNKHKKNKGDHSLESATQKASGHHLHYYPLTSSTPTMGVD
jgi:hypothetical protein